MGISLEKFADGFCDWNKVVKINDNDLNEIVTATGAELFFKDGEKYNPELMKREVVCFDFFVEGTDADLVVRVA